MNQRDRFVKCMHFQGFDRAPFWGSLGVWKETLRRWHREGLPEHVDDEVKLVDFFDLDKREYAPVNFRFVPPFEYQVVHEDNEFITYINDEGVVLKERKDNPELSMPQFIEFPVKSREDFREKVKFRMNPDSPERFPDDWEERCREWRTREVPLFLIGDRVGGFFGPLRGMMGLERLSYAFYDDPALVEEMMDCKLELMLGLIKKVLATTTIDCFIFWEDMAYNHGSLLSPAMFKKYMMPRYKKITEHLRTNGVDIIMVDSDGNINELIPLWLESGVNGFYPLEVQSGMDVLELRKRYGRDVLLVGGLDKKALARDKKAIEDEVLRKVPPLVSEGGYIPAIDHSVPPDVPFENFCCYVEFTKKLLEKG